MRISIIGGGNGGQAMAGHFSLLGHQVTLYNRTFERIKNLSVSKVIKLNEAIVGSTVLDLVTSDLRLAIHDAELIMITTTANAHKELARKMAPYLKDEQIIVLNPGRTLGALEFSNELRQKTDKKIYVAEAQSLIYACRLESPGNVKIIGIKDKVLLSAFPNRDTNHIVNILNSVYPCFVQTENILKTSLENIGAIFHPTVILFNAAAIERGSVFYFYSDMTPSIANFLIELDKERLKVGLAFGIELLSVTDWVSYAYSNIEGITLCDKMRNNPAYYKILAPNALHSRLLIEDVPTGILPLCELGRLANVKTPLLDSILNISQTLLGLDFTNTGRTLKNLGLEGVTIGDFKNML